VGIDYLDFYWWLSGLEQRIHEPELHMAGEVQALHLHLACAFLMAEFLHFQKSRCQKSHSQILMRSRGPKCAFISKSKYVAHYKPFTLALFPAAFSLFILRFSVALWLTR
jgi:hypothetical protein